MGIITWNGIASNTLGIIVEKYPSYNGTARRYETVVVPGRNGSLLFDLGGYENVVQQYEIAKIGTGPAVARKIREWLLGVVGYATLSDSYESGYFRNAYYDGPTDIENVLNQAGRATIRFVCGPEHYLTTGDTYTTVDKAPNDTDFVNNYSGIALPLIECRNTSGNPVSGTISITDDYGSGNAYTITVTNWSAGQWLRIDSLLRDCYNSAGPVNSLVTFSATGEFPRIRPGATLIVSWSGSFTSVVMKPRWWTL